MNDIQQRLYLAFHGDYNALKNRGFVFQKLYANNYLQWALETEKHLGYVRVWKRGAEVTVDELTNYAGSFFQGLLALQANNQSPRAPRHASDYIEFIKDDATAVARFDDEAFNCYDAQRRASYAYCDLLNDKYGHIDDAQAQREAAQKDGHTFPEQRYYLACISPQAIQPVLDMIAEGWVTVALR